MYPYSEPYFHTYPRPQGQGIEPPRNRNVSPTFFSKSSRKLDFHTAITSTQNIISTVSEAIPLYTQMKPIIQSGGKMLQTVTKTISSRFSPKATHKSVVIEPEIVEATPVKKTNKEKNEQTINAQSTPSSPLFYS